MGIDITSQQMKFGEVFTGICLFTGEEVPPGHGTWVHIPFPPRHGTWVPTTQIWDLPPPVLTSTGCHRNTHDWAKDGTYPSEMLSCTHCFQICETGCKTIWRQHKIEEPTRR